MKRTLKFAGLLLIVAVGAASCRFAHRRMQEDKTERQERMMEKRQMQRMGRQGQFRSRGQAPGMPGNNMQGRMPGMRGGMGMGQGFGMGRGRGQMMQGQMGPGLPINRIPNLTDKQRKEILDLQQKQMQEMDKFREEMSSKMQSMREANRTKVMSILTEEQKKFLESAPAVRRPAAPPEAPQAIKQ